MLKNIIFTGGGSGGHVIPGLTLIDDLRSEGIQFYYIGGKKSIESEIVPQKVDRYFSISTGKLRRYISIENLKDIFKIFIGLIQSFLIMLKFSNKETLVFSTGGFVSVPVVIAAKFTGKKVYIHEQTTRMGLANKICSYFSDYVFVSFEESLKYIKNGTFSGYPVRRECFSNKIKTKKFGHINLENPEKALLFITGGGNGSKLINDKVKENLDSLKEKYIVIHQVGKNFEKEYSKFHDESYVSSAFVGEEMIDLFKMSDVVLSRAGAGTVCELMALGKKSIFIPLKIAQKNEQFHNAKAAEKLIGSIVIEEDEFRAIDLMKLIEKNFKDTSISNKSVPNGLDYLRDKILKFN